MSKESPNAIAPLPHSPSLEGRVVLVTGGALRVGRAICAELARGGARLLVHCRRSRAEAEALAAELGGGALALAADLRSAAETEALFADAVAAAGRIDALVNNASIFARTPFRQMSDGDWDEQLAVNLTAPQRCMRLALRAGASAIVNLVDVAAWQPWKGYGAYSVAKAGLLHLSRVLARELAPEVRVNAIAPGVALFPEDYGEAERAAVLAKVPMGRAGTPEDIARAVRYLLSEPYITGACLPVDGGAGLR